jgi:hypothetical protein
VPPQERNNTSLRLGQADEQATGSLTFEIEHLPTLLTCCGMLDEKKTQASLGAGRKWWAVLAEGRLHLFAHWRDSKERHVIDVRKAMEVSVVQLDDEVSRQDKSMASATIHLMVADASLIFQASTMAETDEWAQKLHHSITRHRKELEEKYRTGAHEHHYWDVDDDEGEGEATGGEGA